MPHSPTRRTFFKAASAAIATSAYPILGANDRINVGVVGLGGRGRDHINYYSTLDSDCRIAAVCDVNQEARERAIGLVRKLKNYDPKEHDDMRKLFESKDVDAVSLPLPNHWHALATIWACQAGKDVYCEKPACHNIFEGQQMVKAARKYNRMVQIGSQSRTIAHKRKAIQMVHDGAIGPLYQARGLCFRRRFSIGHQPDGPVPPGVDWDKFLGPAQLKPYSKNKFAYNWHWFWDTGNGDIGNQGIHEMDINSWALNRKDWPTTVLSDGGKYGWKDDQETPNTQQASLNFGDAEVTFDVRNLPTPPENLMGVRGPNWVGNIFMGQNGFMVLDGQGYQVYKSTASAPKADAAFGAGAGGAEKYEKVAEGKEEEKSQTDQTAPHMKNFFDAIRARDYKLLHAEVELGVHSASYVHLANIAYRLHRPLHLAAGPNVQFTNDAEATAMLTRKYRAPYVVPASV